MARRKIIKIDTDKCNGCGLCIPNCPEGAIQIIDNKVRLVSDLFCDGLGACLGSCPQGAIDIEEREAERYNEDKVMKNIIKHGKNTIIAHLEHLKNHGEVNYLKEAVFVLEKNNINVPDKYKQAKESKKEFRGCPGTRTLDFSDSQETTAESNTGQYSYLRQWPIQLHLVSPQASYYERKDILLAADCTAFAMGNFHQGFLKGRSLTIACPKLDSGLETYFDKIVSMIDVSNINTLTVMTMEVPCCTGLLRIAKDAAKRSKRSIPLKHIVVGLKGDLLKDHWVKV